ncbi:hypothetical protein C5L39_05960 [Corynebacterium alimapuense]|uniref:Uncharacterized protein n=2 Tax=Corynebacterium alimapuense TaxID=1576874 RepID=A0A3M8K6J7_9CORY|nr:hypothetical protein C5L39_05960 [Corynebacterium alimapuense]
MGIITAVLVVWVVVLAVIVGARSTAAETQFSSAGALERSVAAVEEEGMGVVGVSPADIYGEEWIAAAIVCPFNTEEDIARDFEADASELNLGAEGVPEDINYLLLRSADGGQAFDRINRSEIDLCTVSLGGYFDARVMMPLSATEEGGWELLT